MPRFEKGDRVRIDLPNETDPDHDEFHGEHGTVIDVIKDDAGRETGIESDSRLYRIKLEGGQTHDFRERDLRPPIA